MQERLLRLGKYGISAERYTELRAFCLQYDQWKSKLNDIYIGYHGINLDGLPHRSGTSDAVGYAAITAAELSAKCELIESCCYDADATMYDALLRAVTQRIPYEQLQVFSGRRQFYDARKRFFILLDKRRG